MTRPAVVVHDVHKQYRDVRALDGCSFHIDVGECVALLGPNGAGKTTITEILEGYRRQDSGSVEVLGVDPAHGDRAWKSQLGIVLQTDRDLGDLTVVESVEHFAGYYPNPRDPDEVIRAVGLEEKRTSRNEKLSGGQRRRLDVALGIVGRPRVLFLDEPTTGFDPEARREFWSLIEALKAEGTTILLTTHYLEEAERLADRVAVISRGRVLACDTPAHLGGRERSSARVSWLEDGVRVESQTMEPGHAVVDLMARFGGEIPGLEVRRETLEDIYLGLIAEDRGDVPPMVEVDIE
ncbi:MAG: ATP-binding cassette domain-containing protein [Actinomycetales bacterium]|nr:ATP-binding cassette domain-containing protein [Actinomycetales bacterium]